MYISEVSSFSLQLTALLFLFSLLGLGIWSGYMIASWRHGKRSRFILSQFDKQTDLFNEQAELSRKLAELLAKQAEVSNGYRTILHDLLTEFPNVMDQLGKVRLKYYSDKIYDTVITETSYIKDRDELTELLKRPVTNTQL